MDALKIVTFNQTELMIITSIFLLIILLLYMGCREELSVNVLKDNMIDTDREFSKYSVEHGRVEAFKKFMTDDAILFKEETPPINGREEYAKLMENTGEGTLKWDPYYADVASSGDLGYTLGKWEFYLTNAESEVDTSSGYYVSIWKLQPDKTWKFVFDTGINNPPKEEK
ncbi:YybH family protein [candidate division KSB1 bacterium]